MKAKCLLSVHTVSRGPGKAKMLNRIQSIEISIHAGWAEVPTLCIFFMPACKNRNQFYILLELGLCQW